MILITLAQEIGLNPKRVASTNGGEYKSPCPVCGGDDRFIVWPNYKQNKCYGRYWCRSCHTQGDSIKFCQEFLRMSYPESFTRVNGVEPEKTQINTFIPEKATIYSNLKVNAPSTEWQTQAKAFVQWANKNLLHNPKILESLSHRGIPLEAVKRYYIGWCDKDYQRPRVLWGLPEMDNKPLYLPMGIVIPSIEPDGSVSRIKIRRHNWSKRDDCPRYQAIPGSMNGLIIIGDSNKKVMVVVESELDAYATHFAAGDFVCVVAVGSNIKNPDNVTDRIAKNKEVILICHDNDDPGQAMLDKWQNLYKHAKGYPTPRGKDIGEAIEQNLHIRKWLIDALPEKLHKELGLSWSPEDQTLIAKTLAYIESLDEANQKVWESLKQELFKGPLSPRARSGELQNGLKLMMEQVKQQKTN